MEKQSICFDSGFQKNSWSGAVGSPFMPTVRENAERAVKFTQFFQKQRVQVWLKK